MAELRTKILLRNDTAQAWKDADVDESPVVLGKGEVGIENDTGKMKLGDGVTRWSKLGYFKGDIDLTDLDATSVYFADDITLAGDYDKVGNVKLKDGTLSARNKSVAELFTEIFTKEIAAHKNADPKISAFSVTNNGNGTSFEAGTSITPKWNSTFYAGDYNYKATAKKDPITPVDTTGVAVTSWEVLQDSQSIGSSEDGTGSAFILGDSNVIFTIEANYGDGYFALSNLNKLPKDDVQIKAGKVSATSTISTYRKMFAGGTKTDAVDSVLIRGLSSSHSASTSNFEFAAKVGDTKMIFAYPKTMTSKVPVFEYFTMSWEGFSGFIKVTDVEVADKRGGENGKVTYTVYEYVPAGAFEAPTKFRVHF